jgi:hypothetical protein
MIKSAESDGAGQKIRSFSRTRVAGPSIVIAAIVAAAAGCGPGPAGAVTNTAARDGGSCNEIDLRQGPELVESSSRTYDQQALGYADSGSYVLDTNASGNFNSGHDYGTQLSPNEKQELIEYLKTL